MVVWCFSVERESPTQLVCPGLEGLSTGFIGNSEKRLRKHILTIDLVVQGVEAVPGFCLRFRV
ncbi:hypothetical protein EOS_26120 [Caballeronia mineralivorans PML1(12)]|uniref:Uncharacterized protein n=1 Tax=Caballeronia mineralivorans PML1(12) TaxID=908627 RepID=A0A0J1FTZ0_9BURK|nr:hypothetical protein EOS_26120 [Caballeronia mineralivorans PML1(12)]